MIVDLADGRPERLPTFDVCVVGSGPAGATIAKELAGSGLAVAVLESGRRRPTRHGDGLRALEADGLPIKSYSRERVLGGTSTTWAGLSSPLDAIDLAPRSILGLSSWPLSPADLAPFYAAAAERYEFPALDSFGPAGFGALRAGGDLVPTWRDLEEKVFLARSTPQNFAKVCADVWERGDVHVFLDATVVELLASADRRGVRAARVRSSSGADLEIAARAFVLATGGVENARLLLLSRGFGEHGAGNAAGLVGRGFMNHPKNYHGVVELERAVESLPYYFGCMYRGFAGYAGLRLKEERQRELGLLNSYVRFEPLFPWSDSRGVESLVHLAKNSKLLVDHWRRRGEKGDAVVELRDYAETGDDSDLQNERKGAGAWAGLVWNVASDLPKVVRYATSRLIERRRPKVRRVRLRNFMEMEPAADNRVELSERRDVFGSPLPRVVSRCTSLDRRSLVELHRVLTRELAAAGVGRLTTELREDGDWPIDQDASHHLGTTRMAHRAQDGVVDAHSRVFGIDNLFVAGGSVFPTSGCANPTFTIVALSIRLAKVLRREVRGA
jgi:choline dehydrogenase-like flavoprotein